MRGMGRQGQGQHGRHISKSATPPINGLRLGPEHIQGRDRAGILTCNKQDMEQSK